MSEQTAKKDNVVDINQKYLGDFTKNELTTLRNTIAQGTNDQEFMLFVQTCVNTGLNPFLGHIHCMVYDGRNGRQLSIQISSEGVLYLARKQKGYKGVDAQLVHENDDFVIDLATKKIVKHEIGFPRGRVIGGYCIARHTDFEDKILLMDVAEVEHMKKGRNANMWNTWFNDMFKKHMLKRVAKEQYGIDLTEDENSTSKALPQEMAPQGRVEVGDDVVLDESAEKKKIWNQIEENVDDAMIKTCMGKYFKGKSEGNMSLQDLVALQKFITFEQNNAGSPRKKSEPEIIEAEEVNEFDELNSFFD